MSLQNCLSFVDLNNFYFLLLLINHITPFIYSRSLGTLGDFFLSYGYKIFQVPFPNYVLYKFQLSISDVYYEFQLILNSLYSLHKLIFQKTAFQVLIKTWKIQLKLT